MRFADGSLAATPIALCEVQGYVYAALVARGHCATEAGDHELAAIAARAGRRAEAAVQRGLLGRQRRRRLLRDRASTATSAGSTASARTWATACGPGIVDEEKAPHVARALVVGRRCSAAGACARCRPTTAATTRSRTTAAACGRTTTRSCAAGLMRYGFVDEAHRVMRGLVDASRVVRRPAARAVRGHAARRAAASRSATRRRARRRRGRPRRRCCSCARCCASSPTSATRSCTSRPAVPDWIGTLRLERIPIMGGHLGGRGDGRGRAGARGAGGPHDRGGSAAADALTRRCATRVATAAAPRATGVSAPACALIHVSSSRPAVSVKRAPTRRS